MQLKQIIWLLVVLSLAACQSTPAAPAEPPAEPPANAQAVEVQPTETPSESAPAEEAIMPVSAIVQSDQPRDTAATVDGGRLATLVSGNSQFALDLYQTLRSQEGNLFFSPFSVSSALAMTYAGARNQTEAQMAQTLHYQLPQAELHPAFNALDLALSAEGAFTLRNANSIWGQQGFSFQSDFLDTLALNYGAGLRQVDYINASEQARQAINDWVAEETEDKIQDLIPDGALTQDTRLVLANAIYFNGKWEFPFNPAVDGSFTLLNNETVTTPMMSRRASFRFSAGPNYQAVALPYQGGEIEMLIIMPAPGEFEAVESSLNPAQLVAIAGALQPGDIELTMPKFSFESQFQLRGTLAQMGMSDAFDPNAADFSGMTGQAELFISDVVHKAFVAVDEEGTEAAAATGVMIGVTSMPEVVALDHPFIFAIQDTTTGTTLFVGRVLDPRG